MQKLRIECDNARRNLTFDNETIVVVKKIHANHDLKVNITRIKFEELCYDLFQRCIPPLINAMKDAEITVNDLTEIVLTGGLTKTPMLRKILEDLFKGKTIKRPDNHHDLSA